MAKSRKTRPSILRLLQAIDASPEKAALKWEFRGYAVNGQWFRLSVGDDAMLMGLLKISPSRRCERVLTKDGLAALAA